MKSLIITCRTIQAEVDKAIQQTDCRFPVIYLESALHNEPDKLRSVLQEALSRASNVDQVLLVMGYCGNAILGLKPAGFRLVVPRADDCLTMLLGSQQKRTEVQRTMPTYFFSSGWLASWEQMERTTFEEYERTIKRYGKEKADKILRITFKHYKRVGVIDTGEFPLDELMAKAQVHADFLNLKCEAIPGTLGYLKKFLTGPWDNDFIVIDSGETIVMEQLFGKN
ncbi:DUF1638 domain-containing protein [Sporomusa sp.]|uniref:DUF1638 domain-containing protein n=1 Tax=Sporomusa sp. TaxID=2078658 RepID=UPI002C6AB39E|nr:DUF1638 domain-containing protein [Sporomusa sp.]MDF2876155.1 hypothetical protein [Sporomusa sp.]HWR05565.1 DUF1638 domain-containing protein [Sporomusa sp.]